MAQQIYTFTTFKDSEGDLTPMLRKAIVEQDIMALAVLHESVDTVHKGVQLPAGSIRVVLRVDDLEAIQSILEDYKDCADDGLIPGAQEEGDSEALASLIERVATIEPIQVPTGRTFDTDQVKRIHQIIQNWWDCNFEVLDAVDLKEVEDLLTLTKPSISNT